MESLPRGMSTRRGRIAVRMYCTGVFAVPHDDGVKSSEWPESQNGTCTFMETRFGHFGPFDSVFLPVSIGSGRVSNASS